VDWTVVRYVMGAVAAVFAGLLFALPGMRVAQGQLPLGRALAFWLGGAGFTALALAAFAFRGAAAQQAVLIGVIAVVAGNLWQRRQSADWGD
jgi:multidrug transporter EmrE-like cation transporter